MEKNMLLRCLKQLDISVLLKNMSEEKALFTIIDLYEQSINIEKSLHETFIELWELYSNGTFWEWNMEMHGDCEIEVTELKEVLRPLIVGATKEGRNIPSLIEDKKIDIRCILYELSKDEGFKFINTCLDDIGIALERLELSIENEKTAEKEINCEHLDAICRLKNLRSILTAILNFQDEGERLWEIEYERYHEELLQLRRTR